MGSEIQKSEPAWSVGDLDVMAERVAKSRLFGLDAAQAFTLMMLAQSEGIHPIKAVQRYHIVQGRPAMKADAMLADFQSQGGSVEWLTDSQDREKAEAIFRHPRHAPNGQRVAFGINDAKAAGLAGKDNWRQYPSSMLRARVVSIGIRMVAPGIVAGLYTPEETADMPPLEVAARVVESRPRPPGKEHHAENHDNQTGHGSGAYAPPEVVKAYQDWLAQTCEEVNAKWLDSLVDPRSGEMPSSAPGEIVTTWQLGGHLLKWARASNLVQAPGEVRAGQRDKFTAVAWYRHRDELRDEARAYCRQCWREAKAKLPRKREPGDDDGPGPDEEAVLDELARISRVKENQ